MAQFEKEKLLELVLELELENSEKQRVFAVVNEQDEIKLTDDLTKDEEPAAKTSADMHAIIGKMSVPEKIKLALFGNQTARNILLRDRSSKQIPMFVLHNPRITDGEIQDISKNTNVDDQILRAVANHPQWMKSYAVKWNIVSNPKVPVDITLKWIKFIQEKDLRRLAGSKNIPQVLATHCRRLIDSKKAKTE